jgi:hypothetical protein
MCFQSHASGKARWEGECSIPSHNSAADVNAQARLILRSIVDLTISEQHKSTMDKKVSS